MVDKSFRCVINGFVLPVRCHLVLGLSPEMVHGIELGRSFRKPEAVYFHFLKQGFSRVILMASVAVEQQMEIPATILGPQLPEKKLEVDSRKARSGQ